MMLKTMLAGTTAILCGATLWAGAALAADAVAANAGALKVKAVEFTPTPAPATEMEMTAPITSSKAVVTLADGTKKEFPLSYVALHRSGDFVGGWYSGLIVDKAGAPIMQTAKDAKGQQARGPFKAAGPDGTSLLMIPNAKVDGVKGHTLFLVNHLEYDTEGENIDPSQPPVDLYGQLPMAMNLTVLDQDPETGKLTPVKIANVDFSETEGLWIPCNGSTTPWMTHLGSEEYEPDARAFEKKPLEAMNLYRGTVGKTAAEGGANPYMYGHLVEVSVQPDGATRAVKHFSMGRLAFELGDVMGDRKTVYMGDDGDDVIRAMYVADKEGDLSAGTLYAAKWVQEDGAAFGKAKLQWIKLGHATDAEVKAIIDTGVGFSDIWEVAPADAVKAEPAKFAGFKPVFAYPGTGSKPALEYFRLKPGMEKAAAFLETRRYAAWLGATTEFTKMEGQAHNNADKKLYTVISYVRDGMIDGKGGPRPQDDIRLTGDAQDLTCGAIYESDLKSGQKDTAGEPIASDWVAAGMRALVYGAKQPADAKTGKLDKCDTEKVANPDNVRYSEAMRTLFIGEDSGNHLNNFIWAYNVDSKALTRIFSAPIGAENTGLSVFDDYNGHAYITANIQHPGAAEDLAKYPDSIKAEMRRKVDERGWVGYFQGLPAVTR
ncbi:PhoX family protein [Azospirillum sp. sgz302134]